MVGYRKWGCGSECHLIALFLLFGLLSAHWLGAQDTTGVGAIVGRVLDEGSNPIAAVKVCVAGLERCAATDTQGNFFFPGLRAGEYQLEVTLPTQKSLQALSDPVRVRAGLEAAVELTLPSIDAGQQSVTVTDSVYATPEEVKNSYYHIQPRELLKSAGADQDISRYVQSLPGVVFGSDDFRNDIVVRGGSPLENLFVVDNIDIANINSFATLTSAGGSVSLLDPYLIQDVTFLAGGAPAPYSNRLSGVLQVAEREGNRERLSGQATFGSAGAGGIIEGPLHKGKGSWVISVRRSFLDLFTRDIGFGGVPVNSSFNAKLVYDFNPSDRVWISNISGVDHITIYPDGVSPNQQINTENVKNNGWRTSTGLNWQHAFGAKAVGLLGLTYFDTATHTRVGDQLRNDLTVYTEDNRESQGTVKYDLSLMARWLGKLQAGGSWSFFHIVYNTQQPYGYNNPFSPVPAANAFSLHQDYVARQSGGYLQATHDLTPRLNLTLGGRIDRYPYIDATRFSPRVGLSVHLTDKLSWDSSFGTYYQQPVFLFLSVFPQNLALKPMRSNQVVSGIRLAPSSSLRMSVEGYWKRYLDYPAALEYPELSVANIGNTFDTRGVLFPMTSAGKGQAEGVEFFVEKRFTRKFFGQTNLAWSRTRHAGLDGILRPGAYDSPIVFNAVAGYQFNRKWEISSRFVFLNGRPYTPFDLTLSQAQNRAVYDLTKVNGVRAPDYVRFDFRVDRTFTVHEKPLVIFAGIENLFNRQNFQELDWNSRSHQPELTHQMGIFPLIGLNWRF